MWPALHTQQRRQTHNTMNPVNTTTRRVSYKVEIQIPVVTNEMETAWSELNHEQLSEKYEWYTQRRLDSVNVLANPHANGVERRNHFAWMLFMESVLNSIRIRMAYVGQREMDIEMGNG